MIEWLTANWETVGLIVTGLIAALSHIMPHTKTELDDKAHKALKVGWNIAQKVAGNYGNAKNEQKP